MRFVIARVKMQHQAGVWLTLCSSKMQVHRRAYLLPLLDAWIVLRIGVRNVERLGHVGL